jgi:hypothetical protein
MKIVPSKDKQHSLTLLLYVVLTFGHYGTILQGINPEDKPFHSCYCEKTKFIILTITLLYLYLEGAKFESQLEHAQARIYLIRS